MTDAALCCCSPRTCAEAFGAAGETIAKSRHTATASARQRGLFIVRGDVGDQRMTHLRKWLNGDTHAALGPRPGCGHGVPPNASSPGLLRPAPDSNRRSFRHVRTHPLYTPEVA